MEVSERLARVGETIRSCVDREDAAPRRLREIEDAVEDRDLAKRSMAEPSDMSLAPAPSPHVLSPALAGPGERRVQSARDQLIAGLLPLRAHVVAPGGRAA